MHETGGTARRALSTRSALVVTDRILGDPPKGDADELRSRESLRGRYVCRPRMT
jgi:hypothetical protein